MKKYLQPCELGGSLYGKKRKTGKTPSQKSKSIKKEDLMRSYSSLYKDQFDVMNKLFKN